MIIKHYNHIVSGDRTLMNELFKLETQDSISLFGTIYVVSTIHESDIFLVLLRDCCSLAKHSPRFSLVLHNGVIGHAWKHDILSASFKLI